MVELFPLPNEGVLLPTRSATSRCLKTEYTDHQVRYEDARRYIPSSVPYEKTGEFVLKALEYYHRHLERLRDDAR